MLLPFSSISGLRMSISSTALHLSPCGIRTVSKLLYSPRGTQSHLFTAFRDNGLSCGGTQSHLFTSLGDKGTQCFYLFAVIVDVISSTLPFFSLISGLSHCLLPLVHFLRGWGEGVISYYHSVFPCEITLSSLYLVQK